MDGSRLKHLWDGVKSFLLDKLGREALVFAFFVLLSSCFWLLQALNETYDMELEYDLVLEHVPEGTVITSELPSPVHVVLRDKGISLIRYYTLFENHSLKIDFLGTEKGKAYGHVVISHSDFQKLLQPQLDASTRIISFRPDTLEYYFNKGFRKRVPVELIGEVTTDDSYYLAGQTMEPDSVTVWAEKEFLDSLESMKTVPTMLHNLTKSEKLTVPLAVMKGVKVVPDVVTISAEVDIYTEKHVKVPIIGTNFPAGYTLRTFPPSAQVSFRIGAKDYKSVTADNFVLTATYEELLTLPDSVLHLQLRSIPEGVSQVRIQPEAVQFLIEQVEE